MWSCSIGIAWNLAALLSSATAIKLSKTRPAYLKRARQYRIIMLLKKLLHGSCNMRICIVVHNHKIFNNICEWKIGSRIWSRYSLAVKNTSTGTTLVPKYIENPAKTNRVPSLYLSTSWTVSKQYRLLIETSTHGWEERIPLFILAKFIVLRFILIA